MDAKNMVPKQARDKIAGFPDMEPARAIVLSRVTEVIRQAYERAGYAPLETPLVERPEILAAKASGELKNQTYGLRLLNPAEGALDDSKHLGLRFDLTVPLARYAAAHYSNGQIPIPFPRSTPRPGPRGGG